MAVMYYGSHLSEHLVKTPEGYLICYAVPINRTGTQVYTAGELNLPGDPDKPVNVYRLEDDVFAPAALASFEGKDITRGHPPEMLNAENQAGYSKGHMENVRRDGENTVADLVIKDPSLVSDVENGVLREVSCGYNCNFKPYQDGYKQTNIIGNHLAIVPRGRAGRDVAIKDAAEQAEKGRNCMNRLVHGILTAFGAAAKDAKPEEMGELIETTASALDAVPAALDADPVKKAPEAEPAKDAGPAPAAAPVLDALDDRMGRMEAMLAQLLPKKEEPHASDETDLDEMIAKLSGGEGETKSLTIPAEETDSMTGPVKDAAVELLKKVRPAVAAIKDPAEKARITDALLAPIKGPSMMSTIAQAAMDSAKANAKKTQKTSFEQVCADAESAYAARNPHNKKEG